MLLSIAEISEKISQISSSLPPNAIYIIRLVIAAACGAAIGTERSKRQKEAGIRTHLIVALGSALMMIISKYAFFDIVGIEGIRLQADASRIASQVVTGISFLGAGVIFVRDTSIKGLTTAAGIWATSGVGMAIGGGLLLVGVFSSFLIIFLQTFLHKYATGLEGALNTYIKVTLKSGSEGSVSRLIHCLDEHRVEIINQRIKKGKDGRITVNFSLRIPRDQQQDGLGYLLEEDDDVIAIEV